MADGSIGDSLQATLIAERQSGLRLAIKGRVVALALLALWLGLSRQEEIAHQYLLLLTLFALVGGAHYLLIGTPWDRPWLKYLIVTLDVAILSGAIALAGPLPTVELPPPVIFRFELFHYYYLIVAIAAFAYAPGLVLWAGVASATGWLLAYLWIGWGIETLQWWHLPPNPTTEQYLAVLLHPNFIGGGNRIQEAIVIVIVSALLALVMMRAQRVVRRQAEAERERASITRTLGQYVPEAVAQSLIREGGQVTPVHRTATVLFVDLENFTAIAERRAPGDVVRMLNAYFEAMTTILARHGGIITQFQGDAILATFNVPLEDAEHAAKAVRAAIAITREIASRDFAGVQLKARVGINTGELMAGSVGAEGRRSYTVHGSAVNLAARLEALNKRLGTRVLISQATMEAAGANFAFREVGTETVRGTSRPVRLFTIEGCPD